VSELQGIGRLKLHEGKLEEFKRLSVQAMEIVRAKDTGTLQDVVPAVVEFEVAVPCLTPALR
jgi:hypothetical protein